MILVELSKLLKDGKIDKHASRSSQFLQLVDAVFDEAARQMPIEEQDEDTRTDEEQLPDCFYEATPLPSHRGIRLRLCGMVMLWILDDVSDFGTHGNLVHPSGLICNFCSYSRDFPSNFLSLGSLPPRSCFVPAPRALTLAGQTFHVWLISLTAVGCFVLQVWDSAPSRLLADFHRSAHIASVVQNRVRRRLPAHPVTYLFSNIINDHSAW